MFVELAAAVAGAVIPPLSDVAGADRVLTQSRPLQIMEFLEAYWRTAYPPPAQELARDVERTPLDVPEVLVAPPADAFVHHIAYAMCLENTRLLDIMRRVVMEYRTGERLPGATEETQRWLHVSEEVFFTRPLPFSVRSITSLVRPDPDAVRRNAYYRLLGMDLNHGTEDGRPYPYIKAEVANREFSVVFEAFLREVWKGFANRRNYIGENRTDLNAIDELKRRLHEMLTTRRLDGNLAREEFDAVAMLSWFFLTIYFDTAIVANLNAKASGVADRLRLIGERVGLAPHARSDSYLQLAAPLSAILRKIEDDAINDIDNLWTDNDLRGAILQIITHWSIATGRDLKDPTTAMPSGTVLRATAPGAVPVLASTNGGRISRAPLTPR